MSHPVIKPKRDDTLLTGWESIPDRAPSVMREDRPFLFRAFALVGLFLFVLGGLAIWRGAALVSPPLGFGFATLGVYLLCLHAFAERELQLRRIYGLAALIMFAGAAVVRFVPSEEGLGSRFVLIGTPLLVIGGILIIAVLRFETDEMWRTLLRGVLGLGAIILIAAGIIGGLF